MILNHKKPDISYPCNWEYKVIGAPRDKLEEIIRAACAPIKPKITLAGKSSRGTYYSIAATLTVDSESTRLRILKHIQKHPEVKMVM